MFESITYSSDVVGDIFAKRKGAENPDFHYMPFY